MIADAAILGRFAVNGITLFMDSSSIERSKKFAKHVFIGNDKQRIQILGRNQPIYNVSGYIAATGNDPTEYIRRRDQLIDILDSQEFVLLEHPYYGKIANASPVSYRTDERISDLNICYFDITFEISNTDGNLTPDSVGVSEILSNVSDVNAIAKASIANDVKSDSSLMGVYEGLTTKLTSIGNAIQNAVRPIQHAQQELEDEINDVNDIAYALSAIQDDIVSLAATPTKMADAVSNMFQTINATSAVAATLFHAVDNLFGFGFLDDVELNFDTYANHQIKKNNNILNTAINTYALTSAYAAAADKEYLTVDEIDNDIILMEDQFNLVILNIDNLDLEDALTNARMNMLSLLDARKEHTRTKSVINIGITSPRGLSYALYGTDEFADEIIKLNNGLGISLSGDITVLSE